MSQEIRNRNVADLNARGKAEMKSKLSSNGYSGISVLQKVCAAPSGEPSVVKLSFPFRRRSPIYFSKKIANCGRENATNKFLIISQRETNTVIIGNGGHGEVKEVIERDYKNMRQSKRNTRAMASKGRVPA
jgi:hypothetical protein